MTCRSNARLRRRDSAAITPTSTSMPASRSSHEPGASSPQVGIGRCHHDPRDPCIDQRAGAGWGAAEVVARLERADHGGPRARSPAAASAITSACAVPGPSCQPSPSTEPSRSSTTRAPTMGLGETRPQPRSASSSARRIWVCRAVSTRRLVRSGRGVEDGERQAMRLAACAQRSPVVAFTRSLPSRLSRSAPEFHRVHPPLAAAGSRTVTAGGELHPAPETVGCLPASIRSEGRIPLAGGAADPTAVRWSMAKLLPPSRLANCFISVATATASP